MSHFRGGGYLHKVGYFILVSISKIEYHYKLWLLFPWPCSMLSVS